MGVDLRTRWLGLWEHLGAQGDPWPPYAELTARYAEPHRAYHTLEHIGHCLDELGAARHLAGDPAMVEMALWYHDAIYETRAADNEERSGALAAAAARGAGLSEVLAARVETLILATRHQATPADADAALLVDIDLSILGADALAFDTYEDQVRREYAWVPEPVFRQRRAEILESFLARPALYSTPYLRSRYEVTARANLRRSIDRLRTGRTS